MIVRRKNIEYRRHVINGRVVLYPLYPKFRCEKCFKHKVSKKMDKLNNICLNCDEEEDEEE